MNTLTQEDIKNLIILVNKTPISGVEATTVALLQQKLAGMVLPDPQPSSNETKTGSTNPQKNG